MADEDEEYHLRLYRMKVGIIILLVIEVPLLSLLVLLTLSHLISASAASLYTMGVGIGGMLAALTIADLYVKRKQMKR